MKKVGMVLLAVVLAFGAAGYAAAIDIGGCVSQCVKESGGATKPLCVEACKQGGCPQEIVPVGDPCNPACPNQCVEGASCQRAVPGSKEYICKQ